MSRQYYTLVAGLREYVLDAENKGFDARDIIDEIRGELSGRDRKYLELFYTYYDIENIINILVGRAQFSTLGNFSRKDLEKEMKAPDRLPDFITATLAAYEDPDDPEYDEMDFTKTLEKALWTAYYQACEKSECRFIREWYAFDRDLRNLIAAYTARRLGIHVADELVGDGYVVRSLSRSSAGDFGLTGELEYLDIVMAATGEEGNMVEKEHMIDLLRWKMAEELTTFDYFNINAVLAYLVKVNIVHRWVALDTTRGRQMLRRLLASMSSEELFKEEQAEKTLI